MCHTCKDPAHFEDDDLSDLFGGFEPKPSADADFVFQHLSQGRPEAKTGGLVYEETCPKCGGSGRFIGYTGRVVGNCFHCKGTGKVTFKTSPEERAKQAQQRLSAAERKAKEAAEKAAVWFDDHKPETQWMTEATKRGFNFAFEMVQVILKYGFLTERQLAAVRRCMMQDANREEERRQIEERAPDITGRSLDKIEEAFASAIAHGIKFPKMRLDAFIFSKVRTGANAGAIYVKSIEKDDLGERRYLGKVVDGRFVRARLCTADEQERIIAAAMDPEAAAKAYGQRTGTCSICGRKLIRNESIDRAMGDICAEKFGW
jgi:uncharacterized Zn finger protein (UPF0148 family)